MDEEKEIQTNESAKEGEQSAVSLAIKDLKENMVSKEEYDKVLKENEAIAKTLKDAFNGEGIDQSKEREEGVDCKKLVEKLKSGNLSNLEYIETACKLREAKLETDGVDIFAPQGFSIQADEHDLESAQKVYDVFKECVDQANGDSGVFTAMLQSRMVDIKLPNKK